MLLKNLQYACTQQQTSTAFARVFSPFSLLFWHRAPMYANGFWQKIPFWWKSVEVFYTDGFWSKNFLPLILPHRIDKFSRKISYNCINVIHIPILSLMLTFNFPSYKIKIFMLSLSFSLSLGLRIPTGEVKNWDI